MGKRLSMGLGATVEAALTQKTRGNGGRKRNRTQGRRTRGPTEERE